MSVSTLVCRLSASYLSQGHKGVHEVPATGDTTGTWGMKFGSHKLGWSVLGRLEIKRSEGCLLD